MLPSTIFLPESSQACLFQLWFSSSRLHLSLPGPGTVETIYLQVTKVEKQCMIYVYLTECMCKKDTHGLKHRIPF